MRPAGPGLDLDALKARLAAATQGPWRRDGNHRAKVRGADGDTLARVVPESSDEPWSATDEANADLIAHAPGDLAALVAEVERLRDLVRHQRGPLFDVGLLTHEEYAALAADHSSVARLETYDAVRAENIRLRARAEAAEADREELHLWLACGCMPAESYRPANEDALQRVDAQLARLRDAVTRDRAALVEWLRLAPQCYTDGYLLVGPIGRGLYREENP